MELLKKQIEMHHEHVQVIEGYDTSLAKEIEDNAKEIASHDWQGIYQWVNDESYHHGIGIAQGQLKDVGRNPNFFRFHNVLTYQEKTTKAMQFGDMVHKAILEPTSLKSKYLSDENIIRELGQEYKSPRATKVYKEHKAKVEKSGMTLVPYEQHELVENIVTRALSHPSAKTLLERGQPEKCIYHVDEETELLLRIKPDLFLEDGILVDVKTTDDARPEVFSRKMIDYGYHSQAAYYLDVMSGFSGRAWKDFIFIVIEKEPPFDIALYRPDDGTIELGRMTYRRNLETLKECISSGKWPSYSTQIQSIAAPHWAFQQFEI